MPALPVARRTPASGGRLTVVLGARGDFESAEFAALESTGFFTGAEAPLVEPFCADLPRPVASPCTAIGTVAPAPNRDSVRSSRRRDYAEPARIDKGG